MSAKVKKVKCTFPGCNKKYYTNQQMQYHYDTAHTDKKRTVCDVVKLDGEICGKEMHSSNMKRHIASYHELLDCDNCDNGPFEGTQGLKYHRLECLKKVYACKNKKWCSLTFSSWTERGNHQRFCRETADKIVCGIKYCYTTFKGEVHYKGHLTKCHQLTFDQVNEMIALLTCKYGYTGPIPDHAKLPLFAQENQDDNGNDNDDKQPTPSTSSSAAKPKQQPAPRVYNFQNPTRWMLLDNRFFEILYDFATRSPVYVHQTLTKDNADNKKFPRLNFMYVRDERIPIQYQVGKLTYKKSGFVRGHMAQCDLHRNNLESLKRTHLFSNIVPMLPKFNGGIWKRLEMREREFVEEHKETCHTYKGPIFLEEKGKCGDVRVASHFYMVMVGVIRSQDVEIEVYCVPHQAIPNTVHLSKFFVSLAALEKMTNLLFLPNLHMLNLVRQNRRNLTIAIRRPFPDDENEDGEEKEDNDDDEKKNDAEGEEKIQKGARGQSETQKEKDLKEKEEQDKDGSVEESQEAVEMEVDEASDEDEGSLTSGEETEDENEWVADDDDDDSMTDFEEERMETDDGDAVPGKADDIEVITISDSE